MNRVLLLPFGKYKDLPLSEVPLSYLRQTAYHRVEGELKEAIRELLQANGMEVEDKDPFRFQRLAEQFLDERHLNGNELTYGAVFWNGLTYLYNGQRYAEVKDLPYRLRTYLIEKQIPQSNHLIANTVPIIESLIRRDNQQFPSMPFFVGNDPFPKPENVIAFANGLLDLERFLEGDSTLIPHTPHWVSTACLPFGFDPSAQCPEWERFLGDAFKGMEEQAGLLQEWFGYCLSQDTRFQKFMVWVGPERAGKGTTWEVLRELVGEDSACGFSLSRIASPFGLYPLVGKQIGYCGEVELSKCPDKGRILEMLKSIVGEDTLGIEIKHHPDGLNLKIPCRLTIACNEVPRLFETTGALASRMLMLQFTQSFVGREDTGLKARLLAELPGIANWALQGLVRLRRNGRFTIPACVRTAVEQFKRENSPALQFVQDCLIVERRLNPGNLTNVELTDEAIDTTKGDVERAYLNWCKSEGIEPFLVSNALSQTVNKAFWKNLRTVLPGLQSKPGSRGDLKTYFGIRPKGEWLY